LNADAAGVILTSGNADISTTAGLCTSIWAADASTGACCDKTKIQAAFDAKTAARKTAWTAFITGLGNFNTAANNVARLVYNKSLLKSDLDAIFADTTAKPLLSGLTADQAVTALSFVGGYKTAVANFKTDASACYASMMVAVARGICYGCMVESSGTPANPAPATGVYTMSEASATTMYGKCYRVWSFIDGVGLAVQIIGAVNNKRTSTTSATAVTTAYFGTTSVSSSDVAITDANIAPIWANCISTATVTSTCVQGNVNDLVEAHLNIRDPIRRLVSGNLVAASFSSGSNNTLSGTTNSSSTNTTNTTAKRILAAAADFTGSIVVSSSGLDLTTDTTATDIATFTALDASSVPVYTAPTATDLGIVDPSANNSTNTTSPNSTNTTGSSMSFVTAFSAIAITMITMLNLN